MERYIILKDIKQEQRSYLLNETILQKLQNIQSVRKTNNFQAITPNNKRALFLNIFCMDLTDHTLR